MVPRGHTRFVSPLNTHTPGSLYEAFPPAEAKRLADKLEIHHTPKHGSWLNIAEIELSTMSGQCLHRRIPDRETLECEVAAWETERPRRARELALHDRGRAREAEAALPVT